MDRTTTQLEPYCKGGTGFPQETTLGSPAPLIARKSLGSSQQPRSEFDAGNDYANNGMDTQKNAQMFGHIFPSAKTMANTGES